MDNCSKTEVYIREAERMCNFYSKDLTEQCCDDCPFYPSMCMNMPNVKSEYAKDAINRVQKWSDEHPAPNPKTYADDFFEKHPNARKVYYADDIIPYVKRCEVYGNYCEQRLECDEKHFIKCWNEPYKGE